MSSTLDRQQPDHTSKKGKDAQRYERYRRVVVAAAESDEFELADLKAQCDGELPVFVTRVVGQLEEDGHLERFGAKSRPEFRWACDREQFSVSQWIDSRIFNDRITRAPVQDRPRERLLAQGAAALRTAELLAILVRSGRGGDSALQAGEKISARYSDQLEKLVEAGRGELKALSPAVGETAYCQIMAGIELGRRVFEARGNQRTTKIRSSEDARSYCQDTFARLAEEGAQEEFHIVSLDTKNQVLGAHRISLGALHQTVVEPREVFRPAVKDAAMSVMLVHNHPSGDPTPSERDRVLTERLQEAGQTLGIQVLDHVIVARQGSLSIREYESLK